MKTIVAPALVALGLCPLLASAQLPVQVKNAFGFCMVTDTGQAQAKIWASPVFEFDYPDTDPGGFTRRAEIASEFHSYVGTLGGAGDKSCTSTPTRTEVDAFRQSQQESWNKRMYMIKLGDWREVAWTPAPWDPSRVVAPPAQVTKYFRCYATQTDIPDYSDRSRSVTSGVFAMPVPGGVPMAIYNQSSAYTEQFKGVVRANGQPEEDSNCVPYDTQGEADKAERDYKRLFSGFNMKYRELGWTPDATPVMAAPVATAPIAVGPAASVAPATPGPIGVRLGEVSAELVTALGLPSAAGAWLVEVLPGSAAQVAGLRGMDVLLEIAGQRVETPQDVPAILSRLRPGFQAPIRVWREGKQQDLQLVIPGMPATAAPSITPASSGSAGAVPPSKVASTALPSVEASGPRWCFASISRGKPPLALLAPVHAVSAGQGDQAAMARSLSGLIAAVARDYPGKWESLPALTCTNNSAEFAGETICLSFSNKLFGSWQAAMQFCNASHEQIDARLKKIYGAGSGTQLIAWPTSP